MQQEDRIGKLNGAGIGLSGITDHQDGSYTLVFAGNPYARIAIKLLDEEIYLGPTSKNREKRRTQ